MADGEIHSFPSPAPSPARAGVPPDEVVKIDERDLPSAPDVANVFLGALLLLATLTLCYFAASIILPIIIAFVLMLVLQPAMRLLTRLHVPRALSAILIIAIFFGFFVGLGLILIAPAATWAQKLPSALPELQRRISFISEPISVAQGLLGRLDSLTKHITTQADPLPVTVAGTGFSDRLIDSTRYMVSGLLETVLVLFFLLIAGDTFLRRLVEVLPRFKSKRQAVEIAQQIESDVAAYLLTISLMNLAVGIGTAIVAALCGLGDPLLWGAFAFLLNYIPILGPIIGVVVFFLAGSLMIENIWLAFLPAALYLCIHLIEGETITPMLLARRFTINPVLIVISLVFWYWMWGVPGAIMATPMLAIAKIVCDRIEALQSFGHFIEA